MKFYHLILCVYLFGCYSANKSDGAVAESAKNHLDEIIEIMEAKSINREHIDWDEFRRKVYRVADSSVTDTNTFYRYNRKTLLAIRKAIELLDDGHTAYRTSYGSYIRAKNRSCSASYPTVPDIPDNIGYIKVEAFSGSKQKAVNYSTSLQTRIKEQDREDLIGWIIDLRGNRGGNMWPMIAGVGSILGEGTAGYYIDLEGNKRKWKFQNNSSMLDSEIIHTLRNPSYQLANESPPVAVLINNGVISSGEAIAIAFKKRKNTKFFGTPTCGLSTATYGFPLDNGALLSLTVAMMADREKKIYGDSIIPDVTIQNSSEVVEKAIDWLNSL